VDIRVISWPNLLGLACYVYTCVLSFIVPVNVVLFPYLSKNNNKKKMLCCSLGVAMMQSLSLLLLGPLDD
jgi:O-antigen/teichoic acid export membrane protein